VLELKANCDSIEHTSEERKAEEQKKHQEEVDFLKETNEQLKKNLEALLSAPKK